MFTEQHRSITLTALEGAVASLNRTAAKQPLFREVVDKQITMIREAQAAVRSWATQEPKTK